MLRSESKYFEWKQTYTSIKKSVHHVGHYNLGQVSGTYPSMKKYTEHILLSILYGAIINNV